MLLRSIRILAVLAAMAASQASADIEVDNGRVRALIPGQNKTVGYFDITNEGSKEMALIGASSPVAGAIEMHTTLRDGDMVRMRRLDEVVLPPGETVRFKPAGKHLMLFRVADLGETVAIELAFSDGTQRTVSFRQISLTESAE